MYVYIYTNVLRLYAHLHLCFRIQNLAGQILMSWLLVYVHDSIRACRLRFYQTLFLSRARVLALSLTHTHSFACTLSPSCRTCALSPWFLSHSCTSLLAHTQVRARPFSLSFPPSLPLTLALSLSLSRSVSLTLSISRALSLASSLSLARSLSFSSSLFLPRTHTHARTQSLSHARCTACSSNVV